MKLSLVMRFNLAILILKLTCLLPIKVMSQFWGFSNPVRLSEKINSSAEETTPCIYIDKSKMELYFVRTFDKNNTGGENDQDIWVSEFNNNDWSSAKKVKNLNNENHNAISSIVNDKAYVLYSDRKQTSSAIKIARINDKTLPSDQKWETPEKLNFETTKIDLSNKEFGFCVSKDEKLMVLSLRMNGGYGLEDLYVFNVENGQITHLSPDINSSGYEIAPFLSDCADTLFFASNGLGGYGNCDIFYSVRGKNIYEWSKPVNMGKTINSSKFDAYLIKFENTIYWSSNRDGENADIYYSNILFPPKLNISVSGTDVSIFQGTDGKAILNINSGVAPFKISWSNGMKTKDISNLKKGSYEVVVTDSIGQIAKANVTLTEPQPELKKVIRLPEVRYVLNSWKFINDESIYSFDSLNLVAALLNEYPNMTLELWSHTDSRGNEKANMALSQQRARAVFTYLVREKGIDGRRLTPIGKGEVDPVKIIDPRTGDTTLLSEEYINLFKNSNPTEFERLHQINRRTEGRISSMNFDPKATPSINPNYFIE
jgi:outer membrane protein OmpA-like peptidoglycan-associated protein